MTKKERNRTYKDAYELLPELARDTSARICGAIQEACGENYAYYKEDCEYNLPELYLFYPHKKCWYWLNEKDIDTRLTILAFCIAMTEN